MAEDLRTPSSQQSGDTCGRARFLAARFESEKRHHSFCSEEGIRTPGIHDCWGPGAKLPALIDRRRKETRFRSFGSKIERSVVERELRDLEEDCSGASISQSHPEQRTAHLGGLTICPPGALRAAALRTHLQFFSMGFNCGTPLPRLHATRRFTPRPRKVRTTVANWVFQILGRAKCACATRSTIQARSGEAAVHQAVLRAPT